MSVADQIAKLRYLQEVAGMDEFFEAPEEQAVAVEAKQLFGDVIESLQLLNSLKSKLSTNDVQLRVTSSSEVGHRSYDKFKELDDIVEALYADN